MLGQSLLHYQITAKLGQGGMGEVYRATDTKLDREVAIKVLPSSLSANKERLARFEREARVLAQLNHPNIATVHGFDQHDETSFLVMEHVEGEDLSTRLKKGPLSIDKTLDLCRQIAAALSVAHAKGIVHRDLKPANIMVTADDSIKVLDFGLAKSIEESQSSSNAPVDEDSPTISATFTQPGMILGTAAYMSPEQAKGKSVDERTDIWAFGCVLFECLTGSKAFAGEDATDTLAGIIKGEPDWQAISRMPLAIRLLTRKCLIKNRNARLQSIADACIDLDLARAEPDESHPTLLDSDGLQRSGSHLRLVALLALTFILGAGSVYVFLKGRHSASEAQPEQTSRMAINLPQPVSALSTRQRIFDVSRDGRILAYVAETEGNSQVFVRPLDEPHPISLPGASPAFLPEISPDGESIAFVTEPGLLKRIPSRGGDAKTLCSVGRIEGMSWENDSIYFCKKQSKLLFRVSDQGGDITEIKVLGSLSDQWDAIAAPYVIPDGSALLFDGVSDSNSEAILAHSFASNKTTVVIADGTHPVYVETGHLLFVRSETLMVAPFDKDSLSITGNEVPLLEELRVAAHGGANVRMNHLGQLFFVSSEGVKEARHQPVMINERGSSRTIQNDVGDCRYVRLSPNGDRIAMVIQTVNRESKEYGAIYVAKQDGSEKILLSRRMGQFGFPVWSIDGKSVYYQEIIGEWDDSPLTIWRRRIDRRGAPEQIYSQPRNGNLEFVDSTGTRLFFTEEPSEKEAPGRGTGISFLDLSVNPPTRVSWIDTDQNERDPSLSYDGRWIAFRSSEPNWASRLFVCPIDDPESAIQLTDIRSLFPFWSRDKLKLFFAYGFRGGNDLTLSSISFELTEPGGNRTPDSLVIKERSDVCKLPNRVLSLNAIPEKLGFLATAPVLSLNNNPAVIHVMLNADEHLKAIAPQAKR